jgi:hypothetical protein
MSKLLTEAASPLRSAAGEEVTAAPLPLLVSQLLSAGEETLVAERLVFVSQLLSALWFSPRKAGGEIRELLSAGREEVAATPLLLPSELPLPFA